MYTYDAKEREQKNNFPCLTLSQVNHGQRMVIYVHSNPFPQKKVFMKTGFDF